VRYRILQGTDDDSAAVKGRVADPGLMRHSGRITFTPSPCVVVPPSLPLLSSFKILRRGLNSGMWEAGTSKPGRVKTGKAPGIMPKIPLGVAAVFFPVVQAIRFLPAFPCPLICRFQALSLPWFSPLLRPPALPAPAQARAALLPSALLPSALQHSLRKLPDVGRLGNGVFWRRRQPYIMIERRDWDADVWMDQAYC